MIKEIPRNLLRFVILVLLQIWVLNNIQLSGFINPYVYILFILMLPFETPGWLLLALSFVTGITIDMFCNTPGIHASSTVLLGFLRPYVLRAISPRDGYAPGIHPRMSDMGFIWFFKYVFLLIVVHHLMLFTMEVFKFSDYYFVIWRTIVSSFFSTIFILIIQLIFRK